jgi:hypothetical protein
MTCGNNYPQPRDHVYEKEKLEDEETGIVKHF